jgi:hypothetical protein
LFEMRIPKELLGLDKLADNVGIMSQHWKSLVCNMDTLLHLSQEKTEMDLAADLEFATFLVATKVGDWPATLGTDSLFRLVEDVVLDIGKLQESVATMESPELAAVRELQLGFKVGKEIMGHLHPVFCLFSLFLRSKDAPGDILEERLHALKSWTNDSPAQAPAAATGPAAWSFHQGPSLQGTSTPMDNEEALTVRVQFLLEAQIKDMQDKMMAHSVQIGSVNFVWRTVVKA